MSNPIHLSAIPNERMRPFLIAWSMIILASAFSTVAACAQQNSGGVHDPKANVGRPVEVDTGGLPRTTERASERRAMVRNQIEARGVRDESVLRAMGNVPRHWFVPENMQRPAYADRPLPIGEGQTISQPYIVAFMTQALGLTPESKVLEVGTGSGYQAAVLAEITSHVYTIEIVKPLAKRAAASFEQHGYTAIETKIGDGYAGWPEHAPFDAVIVTCAPGHIPPKLFEQLKPGGRMCIPVGAQGWGQSLQLITKSPEGKMIVKRLMPVRFVPMTGEARNNDAGDRGR